MANIQQHCSLLEAAMMKTRCTAEGSWSFLMLQKTCWELLQKSNRENFQA